MPCFHPKPAWWGTKPHHATGKLGLVFIRPEGVTEPELFVACGRCVGCRVDRSRSWAVRCYHEAQMHDDNCFLTLTYSPEKLPPTGSLVVDDHQRFLKRLRKRIKNRVRFFHCGEYGDENQRPHYHTILFGYDFKDKKLHKIKNGNKIYTSELLSSIWGNGFCTLGSVTFQSAAYCARYTMKKVYGEEAPNHYRRTWDDGSTYLVKPEYTTQSKGIGKSWVLKYGFDEIFPDDFIVIENRKIAVPEYYLKMLEKADPERFEAVKERRRQFLEANEDEYSPERLMAKKEVFTSRVSLLKRGLDNEA